MPATRHRTTQVPLERLAVRRELNMFPNPDREVSAGIADSMASDGFDPARPIVAWRHGGGSQRAPHVIVEGHTRYEAAKQTGQQTVAVVLRDFPNLEAAQEYAMREQRLRRNLSVEQTVLSMVRAREAVRGDETPADLLAQRWRVGKATVERARALVRYGTDAEVVAVLDGESGLKGAYEASLRRRKRTKAAEAAEVPVEPDMHAPVVADPNPLAAMLTPSAAEVEAEAEDVPEELAHLRDLHHQVADRLDDLDEIIRSRTAVQMIRAGGHEQSLRELLGAIEDMRTAIGAVRAHEEEN